MRPKFRNKKQANIYFLSQRKYHGENKIKIIKNVKLTILVTVLLIGGYILSN